MWHLPISNLFKIFSRPHVNSEKVELPIHEESNSLFLIFFLQLNFRWSRDPPFSFFKEGGNEKF